MTPPTSEVFIAIERVLPTPDEESTASQNQVFDIRCHFSPNSRCAVIRRVARPRAGIEPKRQVNGQATPPPSREKRLSLPLQTDVAADQPIVAVGVRPEGPQALQTPTLEQLARTLSKRSIHRASLARRGSRA